MVRYLFYTIGDLTYQSPLVYCHLWPAPLYNIYPHYHINGTILEEKIIKHEVNVLIFSQELPETFLIPRRTDRDIIKIV